MEGKCVILTTDESSFSQYIKTNNINQGYLIFVGNWEFLFKKYNIDRFPNEVITQEMDRVSYYPRVIYNFADRPVFSNANKGFDGERVKPIFLGETTIGDIDVELYKDINYPIINAIQIALTKDFANIHVVGLSAALKGIQEDTKKTILTFFKYLRNVGLFGRLSFSDKNNFIKDNIFDFAMPKDLMFVIPAKKGSKENPYKNRYLLEHTLNLLDKFNLGKEKVIISTDDEKIVEYCESRDYFNIIRRDEYLSEEEASVKEVLSDAVYKRNLYDSNICLLYLTYPYREAEHLKNIINYYYAMNADSLLCLQPIMSHPYLTMKKVGDEWQQVVQHDLLRKEDYPECREIAHYVCMCKGSEITGLNKSLYGKNTTWYLLEDRVREAEFQKDMTIEDGSKDTKEILLIGNDKSVQTLDKEKLNALKQKGFITMGVNRIWEHYYPDILYFEDFEILKELDEIELKVPSTTKLYTNLRGVRNATTKYRNVSDLIEKFGVTVIDIDSKEAGITCRHSIGMAIRLIHNTLFSSSECNVYLYGVSLDHSFGHSWVRQNLNNMPGFLYDKRFLAMKEDIRQLKSKFNIYSTMEYSSLNEFLERKSVL